MQWKQVDPYHMTSGSWTIAKYFSPNSTKYGLSQNNKNLGYYDTLEKAKQRIQNDNDK